MGGHEQVYLGATLACIFSVWQLREQVRGIVEAVDLLNEYQIVPCPGGLLDQWGKSLEQCYRAPDGQLQARVPEVGLYEHQAKTALLALFVVLLPAVTIMADWTVRDARAPHMYRAFGAQSPLHDILEKHNSRVGYFLPELVSYCLLFAGYYSCYLHGHPEALIFSIQLGVLAFKTFFLACFCSGSSGVTPALRSGLIVAQFISSFIILTYGIVWVLIVRFLGFFHARGPAPPALGGSLLHSLFVCGFMLMLNYSLYGPVLGDTLRSIRRHYDKNVTGHVEKLSNNSSWFATFPPPEIIEINQKIIDSGRVPDKVYAGHLLGVNPFYVIQEVFEPVLAYVLNLILRVDRRAMAVISCLLVCVIGATLPDRPVAWAALSSLPALALGVPVAAFPVGHSAGPRTSNLCKLVFFLAICAVLLIFMAYAGVFGISFVESVKAATDSSVADDVWIDINTVLVPLISFTLGPIYLLAIIWSDQRGVRLGRCHDSDEDVNANEESQSASDDENGDELTVQTEPSLAKECTKESTNASACQEKIVDLQSLRLAMKYQKRLRRLVLSILLQAVCLPLAWLCQTGMLFDRFWIDSPLAPLTLGLCLAAIGHGFTTSSIQKYRSRRDANVTKTDLWFAVFWANLDPVQASDVTSVSKTDKRGKEKIIAVVPEKQLSEYARFAISQVFTLDSVEVALRIAFVCNCALLMWQVGVGEVLMGASCETRAGSCEQPDGWDRLVTWSWYGSLALSSASLWRCVS